MKKYTPVFGPQELFDGCLNDVVCVSKNDETGEIFQYTSIVIALRDLTKYKGDSDFTVAMRRIEETPVPKRWTAEDQKAGRLPEVGSEAKRKATGKTHEIIRAKGGLVTWWDGDDIRGYSMLELEFMSKFCPIETPDEKAIRLEGEFVRSFLSNDLNYERGLRDAYRKLKVEPPVQAKDGE